MNCDWPGLSGLGTSTAKEAKEYFSDMARHRIPFKYANTEDDTAIELVSCVTFCISLLLTLLTEYCDAAVDQLSASVITYTSYNVVSFCGFYKCQKNEMYVL